MEFITKRPALEHPNPVYWAILRKIVIEEQNNRCATCWNTGEDVQLDLHHRHYNNFGSESREDVVILCRLCHDSITSSIRSRRYGEKEMIVTATVSPSFSQEAMTYGKAKLD